MFLKISETRVSADLALVFVDNLSEDNLFLTKYWEMDSRQTTVIIKRDALFLTEEIAHEIGHILGAGHNPDPGNSKTYYTYALCLLQNMLDKN